MDLPYTLVPLIALATRGNLSACHLPLLGCFRIHPFQLREHAASIPLGEITAFSLICDRRQPVSAQTLPHPRIRQAT